MDGEKKDGFDFGLNDEDSENIYGAEIAHQRVEKLSIRLTLISVLIPCLIGVILLLAYFDVKKKYEILTSQGAQVAQDLSKDLESTSESLSVQVAQIKKNFEAQTNHANKSIESLKKTLAKAEKNYKKGLGRKVDEKALKELKQTIDTNFQNVGKGLVQVSETIRKIESRFSQELVLANQTIAELQSENEQLRKGIGELEAIKAKLVALEAAAKAGEKRLSDSLMKMRQQIADRISAAEKQIADLKTKTGGQAVSPKPSAQAKPKAPSPSPQTPAKEAKPATSPTPAGSPPAKAAEPKPLPVPPPGKIIEQDIQ